MAPKRNIDSISPSPISSESLEEKNATPKKQRSTPSPKGKKSTSSPTVKSEWTSERRLKLFQAFVEVANVKWEDVAAKLGDGSTSKMCREQWQRGTGKKIREALSRD
ncbi:hypothetical protein M231_04346 [Tremella mesenterica]|uniref:Myb-like domain-containing protein n=1 Tax=Tremella mesenterica TaxID=5217 RepID=A0A4V1M3Y0_TREME|nr:hypothetical protein M231_04346 [Tremella mesenterica]